MNEIIKKNAITFGIMVGIFSILVTTFIYVIDIKMFTNIWIGLFLIAVYIAIGIILIVKTKKQLNNFIGFKDAFTVYFISAIIASTISVLFNIVLFNYVDPGAKETLKEMTIQYSVEMMQKFGATTEQINESVAKIQETDNYSIKNLLLGMLFSYVISAVLGLILALIFRSKPSYKE